MFATDGFEIVTDVFSHDEMDTALRELPSLNSAGSRHMLSTEVGRKFAEDPRVKALVEKHLGNSARCVRGILFDKTDTKNWALALHQDTKVALRQREEVPGFTNWSVKEGIVHAQPPVEMLEQSMAVRIHLDPCPVESGALVVVPGSHLRGFAFPTDDDNAISVPCEKGDVILMSPLLFHGSGSATVPKHRRVLHLEFCSEALPPPLEWAF